MDLVVLLCLLVFLFLCLFFLLGLFNQFKDYHFSSIPLSVSSLEDSCVSTLAFCKERSDFLEEFCNDIFVIDVLSNLSAVGDSVDLSTSDHFFGHPSYFKSLCLCGLDSLISEERCDHVALKGLAFRSLT